MHYLLKVNGSTVNWVFMEHNFILSDSFSANFVRYSFIHFNYQFTFVCTINEVLYIYIYKTWNKQQNLTNMYNTYITYIIFQPAKLNNQIQHTRRSKAEPYIQSFYNYIIQSVQSMVIEISASFFSHKFWRGLSLPIFVKLGNGYNKRVIDIVIS